MSDRNGSRNVRHQPSGGAGLPGVDPLARLGAAMRSPGPAVNRWTGSAQECMARSNVAQWIGTQQTAAEVPMRLRPPPRD